MATRSSSSPPPAIEEDNGDGHLDELPVMTPGGIAVGAEPPVIEAEDDALVRNEIQMDTGWMPWMQVAASFCCYFNHLGLINSFGVFQPYYEHHLLRTSSPSAISWIGSIQVFCLMAIGVIMGPVFDAGHCRALLVLGCVLVPAGFMLASISTRYWQILLSQGICMGLGACALSVPSIALLPMYFKRKRARAMGIATVGSGVGSTVYPLVFQALVTRVGFGWAMRIMGFISLAMCLFALATTRPVSKNMLAGRRRFFWSWRFFIDREALRDVPFLLYCAAIFFENFVYFVPPYYMQSYAMTHGLRGANVANYLVAIANATSVVGRIVPSFVADRFGTIDTFVFVVSFTSISSFYWISVSNAAGNIAFAVLYGFFAGGVLSLLSVVLADVTPDLSKMGTRLGMVSVIKGVASLIGPPISGAILDATGSYLGVQLFAALGMAMCGVLSLTLKLYVLRKSIREAQRKEGSVDGTELAPEADAGPGAGAGAEAGAETKT